MAFFDAFVRGFLYVLSPITLIFTALSVVQLYQGFRRLSVLRTRWADWIKDPLQPWKLQIGRDLSFFAAVPIGVAIHELGHAVIVWLFGGKIEAFGYFFFWGFVVPDQGFAPPWREWLLSVAGTVGNLLFAIVIAALLWRHAAASVRYAAKQTVRFQIYFALIYYPLFTAVLSFGDWRTIYDFDATPVLSSATAVAHAAILLGFWWGDRKDVFEEKVAVSAETQTRYDQLANSNTLSDKIDSVLLLNSGGNIRDAKTQARDLAMQYPQSADAAMLVGLLDRFSLENPTNLAIKQAEIASKLTFERPDFRAYANHVLGFEQWSRGRTERAITFYDEAIKSAAIANSGTHPIPGTLVMYYMRGIAHSALNNREQAISDIEQAISFADAKQWRDYAERFREDLRLLLTKMS